MIDWESPKLYQYGKFAPKYAVNPWRRLFLVNEFNELQGSKHINTDMILLLFLVFTEGFGYKNFALMEASLTRKESNSPENYALMFFVIVSIIFGIGIIQYAVQMLLAMVNPPPYVDFVDLCSVANISVMIFNEELNGYYIHGRSPCGSSDVNSLQLRLNLIAEEMGNATFRGIHSSMPNAQTFEIVMPAKMIDDYKKNFLTPVTTQIQAANSLKQANYSAIQKTLNTGNTIPSNIKMSELDLTKELMNKIMKKYID
jgi:meckelin